MADLSRMKKHVGILTTTGVRCMVVFRKIPGDESHCLIVETDHLSDMYHDNIQEICNSRESQEAGELHEVLNRRTFGDGLNALQALHYKGFLRKVPVTQVTLLPFPNQTVPLEMVNAQMDGNMQEYQDHAEETKKKEVEAERKANPMSDPNDPVGMAQGLLIQAEMLEKEAGKKRAEALELDPSLKPKAIKATSVKAKAKTVVVEESKSRGRPKLSEAEKSERLEERKIKRRERDRANAAKKKADKEKKALKDSVDAKIVSTTKGNHFG